MMTKTYNKTKPYGKITVLQSGKRYWLLAPHPVSNDDWAEKDGLQTWSVVSLFDGFDGEGPGTLSPETNQWLYEPETLVIHPVNIAIELYDVPKEILVFACYEQEPEEETEVDLSEDEMVGMPNYLLDVAPVLDEQYPINYIFPPYLDDGFPV